MLELYGLKIKVIENVYEPAEDTFLLISALEKMDLKNKAVLELGTGSGIVALFAARKAKSAVAADINPKAVECAKENAARNKIKNIEFRESDLFQKIKGEFDLIVFNPPYLPEERHCGIFSLAEKLRVERERNEMKSYNPRWSDDDEPLTSDIALDGGKDGRKVTERFLKAAPKFLNPRGRILLLESSLSGYEKTLAHLKKTGFTAKIAMRQKLDWEELVAIEAYI